MLKINTMKGHERMSTQDLLLAIEEAVRSGETDFDIEASGQHDIGGPLWHPEGKPLRFHVKNAGQRVGSMALPGTEIVVEESASADVGWLNAGGIITVKGDAGDTAGHCSSGGKIFIGGRAVVCGYDSAAYESVLGARSCVGMVGGCVYVRGPIGTHPADILAEELTQADIDFLAAGMEDFLAHIEREELMEGLTKWSEWKKLRPLSPEEKKAKAKNGSDMHAFRVSEWVKGGIFADVAHDDFAVHTTVSTGLYRLRVPHWDNAKFAAPCEANCPTGIPTQRR